MKEWTSMDKGTGRADFSRFLCWKPCSSLSCMGCHMMHYRPKGISQGATPKPRQTSTLNYTVVLWSKAGSKFTRLPVRSYGVQSPQLMWAIKGRPGVCCIYVRSSVFPEGLSDFASAPVTSLNKELWFPWGGAYPVDIKPKGSRAVGLLNSKGSYWVRLVKGAIFMSYLVSRPCH